MSVERNVQLNDLLHYATRRVDQPYPITSSIFLAWDEKLRQHLNDATKQLIKLLFEVEEIRRATNMGRLRKKRKFRACEANIKRLQSEVNRIGMALSRVN